MRVGRHAPGEAANRAPRRRPPRAPHWRSARANDAHAATLPPPGVLLLAATNRPTALDAALLRPGRLDVLLYVPPPDRAGREAVLRLHAAGVPLAPDVDLAALAASTERFTGAELASLVREAAMAALREDVVGAVCVAARHFAVALSGASPGLSEAQLGVYESWSVEYRR